MDSLTVVVYVSKQNTNKIEILSYSLAPFGVDDISLAKNLSMNNNT